tara:strand:- start:692 stop:1807 length:1116 start_codon:yes stop_codon:yes gene_type:complete
MKIGVPSEIKEQESRVGLTPVSVQELCNHGHKVLVQSNAGSGAGFENQDYKSVGASIVEKAEDIFNDADLIVKVKEPLKNEVNMLKENQILFTYLHLSASSDLTEGLVKSKSICIAYETVTDENNRLPLLAPMSAVAGRMSIQAGAHCLEKPQGGSGLLVGGAPGVKPGNILILGGGVVGENAAIIASGLQANTFVVDKSETRLNELKAKYGDNINTLLSDDTNLEKFLSECDLLIGGVLIPGANAPKLISKEMLKLMKPRSVIVDVAIDQGGCVETSKPTTHSNPTYLVEDIVHYCVANMPGAVPRTSTFALNAVTLPFIIKLAQQGYKDALSSDANFLSGLNVCKGNVTYKAVADELKYDYISPVNAIQ